MNQEEEEEEIKKDLKKMTRIEFIQVKSNILTLK